MLGVLIGFGVLLVAVGYAGLLRPNSLQRWVASMGAIARYILAVGVRVAIGVFLVQAAPETRWPEATRALGYITLGAAGILLVMGPTRLGRFVTWWSTRPAGSVRLASCIALAIGVVLIVDAL